MSHDLHFSVQNGSGGGSMSPSSSDAPLAAGSMDHLPDPGGAGAYTQQQQDGYGSPSSSSSSAFDMTSSTYYDAMRNQLKRSSHPYVVLFHLLFKAFALFLYMFGRWFVGGQGAEKGANFITLNVVLILLLAADFWVVKNVTGRFLVGLRWWNKVTDTETEWIFESAERDPARPVNLFDRNVFWTVLYATPAIWTVVFFFEFIKLQLSWLLIPVMALSLAGANVYGYYRCSSDQKQKLQQMMQQSAQRGAVAVLSSNMLSLITGSNTNTSSAKGNASAGGGSNTYV